MPTTGSIADRGLVLSFELVTTKAHSFSEAVTLGRARNGRRRVAGLRVPAASRLADSRFYMLGGPKTIAEAAGGAAYQGVARDC